MNLLTILAKGGYIMIALGITSIIGIAIIIERLRTFSAAKTPKDFLDDYQNKLKNKDIDGILKVCNTYDCPVSRVIKAGIVSQGEMEKDMSAKANEEVVALEKYFGGLATIVGIAPLLGFLGTVTGMIKAFMQVEALGGNVNASVLAGGIWEALVTTATGLAIGIVIYIFYNYFVGRVRKIAQEMESLSTEIISLKVLTQREGLKWK